VTSEEPPVVDPINGWVTGGDGICRQRWSYIAESFAAGAATKVEECGGHAVLPAAYLKEPHLLCVDCHPVAVASPGWEDLSTDEPPTG
jgi:hypothetical protein